MKKLLKVLGALLAAILVLAGAGLAWLVVRSPNQRPASTETVERTPARLARGAYLVLHVTDCLGCHSDHTDRLGWPVKPGTEGQGGFAFDEAFGVPGIVSAPNLTPDRETGLGAWTDGEIMRATREGVSRDGHALFPMMPYPDLAQMSDEDARAIVLYLRTLAPIRHGVPPTRLRFPVNLLVKSKPRPVDEPVATPDDARDHVAYGRYLTTIGGCRECHTPHDDRGERIPGRDFAGGWEMKGPWGRNITANITPDAGAFVGQATRELFVARFRAYAALALPDEQHPAPQGMNTVMPWIAYSGMTDQDLVAIYDYLRTDVKPIANAIERFPDAPPVK